MRSNFQGYFTVERKSNADYATERQGESGRKEQELFAQYKQLTYSLTSFNF